MGLRPGPVQHDQVLRVIGRRQLVQVLGIRARIQQGSFCRHDGINLQTVHSASNSNIHFLEAQASQPRSANRVQDLAVMLHHNHAGTIIDRRNLVTDTNTLRTKTAVALSPMHGLVGFRRISIIRIFAIQDWVDSLDGGNRIPMNGTSSDLVCNLYIAWIVVVQVYHHVSRHMLII